MRLILVAGQYYPIQGGSENFARRLAEGLVRAGHEVEVWTRLVDPQQPREELLGGVRLRRLGPIWAPGRASLRWLEGLVFVARLIVGLRRAAGVDMVFSNQLQYPAAAMAIALRSSIVPCVARVAGSGGSNEFRFRSPIQRFLQRSLLKGVRHVVALGPATYGECVRVGFKSNQVSIIPNGTVVPETPPSRHESEIRAVWVGRFRPEKRADLAIAAWTARPRRGRLLVVGDGPGVVGIRELAGDGSNIRLVGPTDNPTGLYEESNVFLQTSDAEGMSNALIEAMAAGCACVATAVGETRSVLGGGAGPELPQRGTFQRLPAGLIVNPGDEAALDQALVALADPSLRAELGASAHARCLANYRIEDITARYAELFAALQLDR